MLARLRLHFFLVAGAALAGCGGTAGPSHTPPPGDRTPELGPDPSVVRASKVTMSDAVAQMDQTMGTVIEAKFELGGDGKLSLSTYPLGHPLDVDAEKNLFREAAGDPTATPWTPALEVFHDQEHLTRSARDLTLVQLSTRRLGDAIAEAGGVVYWAIPTVENGHAGFGVYSLDDDGDESVYTFVDGGGDRGHQTLELGTGPGSGATDERAPELGADPRVVRSAKTTMLAAIDDAERTIGPVIEAKYERGEDGTLSLSLYPVDHGLDVAAEKQQLAELAGDPTAAVWAPSMSVFAAPDEEHLTRSARDLTLIQASPSSLRDAIIAAQARYPGGFVYWAIPTRRGTTAGYGVYLLDGADAVHYLFIS
jgi:hypothetical protein